MIVNLQFEFQIQLHFFNLYITNCGIQCFGDIKPQEISPEAAQAVLPDPGLFRKQHLDQESQPPGDEMHACKEIQTLRGTSQNHGRVGMVFFNSLRPLGRAVTLTDGKHSLHTVDRVLVAEGYTKLFISGLGRDIREENLLKIFTDFGTVRSVTLMRGSVGSSFGFVKFESTEAARKARSALNGTLLGEQVIDVEPARKLCNLIVKKSTRR